MEQITYTESLLKDKLTGVIRSIEASVQVPGLSEHKFMLNMDFSNCTIEDVIMLSMSPRRISWANSNRAKGEEYLSKLESTQNITVMPIGTRGPVDVEAGFMSKMQSATSDELDAKIAQLTAMKTKTVLRKATNKVEK